jgi:AbrB family looped-hinge helix DNA binding protein
LYYHKIRKPKFSKKKEESMPTATLTSKGQMVIPKAVRDQLGLQPGDNLDFITQENGDVLIRPAIEDIRRLKGLLHRPSRASVSLEDMEQAIRKRARRGR